MSIGNRIRALINRGVLAAIKSSTKNQVWVVKGLEGHDKEVEVFELYGITSSPPPNAEVLRHAIDGFEDHCIALGATGGIYRPTNLADGEVIFYSMWDKNSPHRIHFKEEKQAVIMMSGNNVVTLDNEKFTITTGGKTMAIQGDQISINGLELAFTSSGLVSNKDGTFDGVSVKSHTHGGVESGGSNTGEPN